MSCPSINPPGARSPSRREPCVRPRRCRGERMRRAWTHRVPCAGGGATSLPRCRTWRRPPEVRLNGLDATVREFWNTPPRGRGLPRGGGRVAVDVIRIEAQAVRRQLRGSPVSDRSSSRARARANDEPGLGRAVRWRAAHMSAGRRHQRFRAPRAECVFGNTPPVGGRHMLRGGNRRG